jgi:hypothetical protein
MRIHPRTEPRPSRFMAVALMGVFALTAACDSPSEPTPGTDGMATFQMNVTGSQAQAVALFAGGEVAFDEEGPPMTAEQVAKAEIWISRIYLVGGGQGQVDLFVAEDEEDWQYLDLMQLHAGEELEIVAATDIPEGEYGQLRFEVAEVAVTLAEGYEFAGGEARSTMVPSGFLRVNLHGDMLVAQEGETVVVLADFDLSRSFAFQGPPSAPFGVIIKPVLFQEIDRTVE